MGEEEVSIGLYCKIADKSVERCPNKYNPNFDFGRCSDCYGKPKGSDLGTIARQAIVVDEIMDDLLFRVRRFSHRQPLMDILLPCSEALKKYRDEIIENSKK